MYVCICNGVTDRQVREAAENGCNSMAELTMRTGCGAACGSCLETATAILEPARREREALFFLPVIGQDMSRAA